MNLQIISIPTTKGVVGVGYFQLSSGFPPPEARTLSPCSGTAPLLKHNISLNIFHPIVVFKSSGAITIVLGISQKSQLREAMPFYLLQLNK
jgi:hypothetical protein